MPHTSQTRPLPHDVFNWLFRSSDIAVNSQLPILQITYQRKEELDLAKIKVRP